MRKNYVQLLCFFLFLILCTGCSNKKEENETLTLVQTVVRYNTQNLSLYTVDDAGYLYTVSVEAGDESDQVTKLGKYDLEGNQLYSRSFEKFTNINSIVACGGKVYFTRSGHNDSGLCCSLYSYDEANETVEWIYDFEQFEQIKQLLYLDGRIYVLGYKFYYTSNTDSDVVGKENGYESMGEQLVYYSFSDKLVYELEIGTPISMANSDEATIMIQTYLENEGYCMLEYQPNKDQVKIVSKFDEKKFDYFAVSDSGKKVIYTYPINSRGIVLSKLDEIEVETEIYNGMMLSGFGFGIYQVNGQVYGVDSSAKPVRVSLNEVERENETINYISPGYQAQEPYGCGFAMKRVELEYDKFATKVLAQDQDYDLCLMNSSLYNSYNIRKNGMFYPLNHVEGIEEYLNRCFPYVKEAAINEEGDIWMLPIGVDIPGLVVNLNAAEKRQLGMKTNMTYEEFDQVMLGMTSEDLKKTNFNFYVLSQSFLGQYFHQYSNVNNEMFRGKIEILQQLKQIVPHSFQENTDFYKEDFLYDYCAQESTYEVIYQQIPEGSNLSVYSMPKLDETDKNIGGCIFLAVNPNSKKLEQTLGYLSAWIAYQLNAKEKPLYFQDTTSSKDSFHKALYELYENGEITFRIDRDLYDEGFSKVMEQTQDIESYITETQRRLDTYFNE